MTRKKINTDDNLNNLKQQPKNSQRHGVQAFGHNHGKLQKGPKPTTAKVTTSSLIEKTYQTATSHYHGFRFHTTKSHITHALDHVSQLISTDNHITQTECCLDLAHHTKSTPYVHPNNKNVVPHRLTE